MTIMEDRKGAVNFDLNIFCWIMMFAYAPEPLLTQGSQISQVTAKVQEQSKTESGSSSIILFGFVCPLGFFHLSFLWFLLHYGQFWQFLASVPVRQALAVTFVPYFSSSYLYPKSNFSVFLKGYFRFIWNFWKHSKI